MKKLLLATTALVATAGVAAAEVTITGFAELGVFDPGEDESLQFHTDIDATFTMTAETDSGLSFGADIDLDETDTDQTLPIAVNQSPEGVLEIEDIEIGGSTAFDNSLQGGESIFISGAFGTLTMGDTDGAFDWAVQEAIIGSALNDDHEHLGYSGNAGLDGTYDGQIARYEYAFGAFSGAVSAELDDDDEGDPVLGVGARYSTEFGSFRGNPIGIGFGLGYQRIDSISLDLGDDDDDEDDTETRDIYGVSADIDLGGGLRAIVNFSEGDNEQAESFQHVGVAVGYTVDALTVAANYGHFNNPGVAVVDDNDVPVLDEFGNEQFLDADTEGYGLIANYDLGGGAEAQFGWSHNKLGDGDDFNRYSAGIAISF